MRKDAKTTGGFAEDGHVERIPAEKEDVIADPAEGELLVHETVIPGGIGIEIVVPIRIRLFRGKSGMGEKPESAKTVIDGDDDDAVLYQRGRIVVIAFANDEGASVDPNHHRAEPRLTVGVWSEDVEEEAILGDGLDSEWRGRLGAVVAELRGFKRCEPRSVPHGWTPAQITHRRSGVRNAEEFAHAIGSDEAADGTTEGGDHRLAILSMHEQRHCAKSVSGKENRLYNDFLLAMQIHGFLPDAEQRCCGTLRGASLMPDPRLGAEAGMKL